MTFAGESAAPVFGVGYTMEYGDNNILASGAGKVVGDCNVLKRSYRQNKGPSPQNTNDGKFKTSVAWRWIKVGRLREVV